VTLADYYLRVGERDQARKVLNQVATERAGFSPARVRLAALAYTEKNPTEAHRLLEEVLKKNGKDVQALLTKSRLLRLEGRHREALTSAQAAATAAPEYAPAIYERAMVETALSQFDDSVKSLREVVRLNPRAVEARIQLATTLLRQRNAPAALPVAEDALRNAPQNPAARLVLARAQMASGDVNASATTLGALQKQFPDAAIVWSQLGALRVMQRDIKGARTAFERAIALQPGQHQAIQGLTLLDIGERNPEAARARVEALVAKAPQDLGYQQIAAKVYIAQRDFPKAESTLRAMLARDSTNLEAYGLLGQVYLMQNKAEQALKEYDIMSRQQPNAVGPHTVAAMLLQSLNRLDEAQQRYERVIQLDRQAPVAANNLAWLYAERGGNLDIALQLAQTARRNLPSQPAVADTLGWVYYKKQQYDLAVRELEDAVEKDPDNPEYQYHLGAAYAAKGEVAKARAALQKAVAKPFAASEDARRALNALPAQGA
jgi:tetratricopeptide (TPR) repeat protein